jgi:hypothetical protein
MESVTLRLWPNYLQFLQGAHVFVHLYKNLSPYLGSRVNIVGTGTKLRAGHRGILVWIPAEIRDFSSFPNFPALKPT